MITDVPFGFAGLYIVIVGLTTFRAMRLPLLPAVCSCHVHDSEPGAAPGQIAKTPAASGVSGAGIWAKRRMAAARSSSFLIALHRTPRPLAEAPPSAKRPAAATGGATDRR